MQTTTGKIFGVGLIIAAIVLAAFTQRADAARKVRKKPVRPSELYLQQGQRIINLTQGDIIFRTALVLGEDVKVGLYGIPQEPAIKAEVQPLEIVVFDPETGGDKVHLTRLGFVETSPASRFNVTTPRLDAANFEKTHKMDLNAPIPINLWCVESEIPVQITPVPQKPGWFSIVPREPLTPGNYAINSGTLDGPRLYTGEQRFYPFTLVTALPPAPKLKKAHKKLRRRAKPKEEVALAPPAPPAPAPPPAAPEPSLEAGMTYQGAYAGSPRTRREYQITNLNDYAWHNVRIKLYARSDNNEKFVLGPVTQEKNIVLPNHTVNQVPDKTFVHYDTLDDAGYKLYLEISAKEGKVKKAWKNIPNGEDGHSNLVEIPWDLNEPEKDNQ
jgi:hypothetical protein